MTEPYIYQIHNKINRSLLSRLRTVCLDLAIETGRQTGVQKNNRICPLYSNGIENEIHFLFYCCGLEHIRGLYKTFLDIKDLDDSARFAMLCSKNLILKTSKIVRLL